MSSTIQGCHSTKMKARGKIRDIARNMDGQVIISLQLDVSSFPELGGLREEDLDITLDKHRNRRSQNANAYLWKLCDLIAQKVGAIGREDVYRRMLHDYGRFEDVLIRDDAVGSFLRMAKYSEVMYSVDGWTCVRVYQGSHEYNSKEMSLLIDGAVTEAQDLGIETLTPDAITRMTAAWKGETNG